MEEEKKTPPPEERRKREFKEMLERHCATQGETAEARIETYEKYDAEYAAELRCRAGIAAASSE